MNKLIAPIAIAVVLSVSAAAYFSGVLQQNLPANLSHNEIGALPKILLLPANFKECQCR